MKHSALAPSFVAIRESTATTLFSMTVLGNREEKQLTELEGRSEAPHIHGIRHDLQGPCFGILSATRRTLSPVIAFMIDS